MLYTTQVTKNLVSISHFTKDNQVFFKFHSTWCLVRDAIAKEVLLTDAELVGCVIGIMISLFLRSTKGLFGCVIRKAWPFICKNFCVDN